MSAAIQKLKEQARQHEHEHDWEAAIAAYREVLAVYEELDDERDLALYNRVGDLYLRLGRINDAVEFYEAAADHYADAGLGNNAIALCSKALRYQPNRISLYRKLTVYSAQQGFHSDARRWYLEYAARMEKAGALSEAIGALDQLPGLSADPRVRETLGRRLLAHGSREAAVQVMLRAHRLWVNAGEVDKAEAIAEEIAKVDPDLRPSAEPDAEDFEPVSSESPALAAPGHDAVLAPGDLALESAAAAAGIDSPANGSEGVTDLPLLEPMVSEVPEAASDHGPHSPAGIHSPTRAQPETESASQAGSSGDAVMSDLESAPLPLIYPGEDFGGDDVADPSPASDSVIPPGQTAVDGDAASILATADEYAAAGRDDDARAELERGHAELAAAGDWRGALNVAIALARIGPDDESAFTRCVEYAVSTGDSGALVAALLSLAEFYERRGLQRRAGIVYQRVLDIDPANDRGRRGLQRAKRHGGAASAFAEGNTRFTLPETAPSGDDARDFSVMLAQFKKKLAEGVGRDDSTSHYDLGLAFREMGLIDEAIAEFQTALRAGEHRLKVYEELGSCFMLSGRPHVAEKVLARALQLPHESAEELAGIHYHLGQCYEAMDQPERAAESYREASRLHPRFGTAADRVPGL